jgi:hypothetical protein
LVLHRDGNTGRDQSRSAQVAQFGRENAIQIQQAKGGEISGYVLVQQDASHLGIGTVMGASDCMHIQAARRRLILARCPQAGLLEPDT